MMMVMTMVPPFLCLCLTNLEWLYMAMAMASLLVVPPFRLFLLLFLYGVVLLVKRNRRYGQIGLRRQHNHIRPSGSWLRRLRVGLCNQVLSIMEWLKAHFRNDIQFSNRSGPRTPNHLSVLRFSRVFVPRQHGLLVIPLIRVLLSVSPYSLFCVPPDSPILRPAGKIQKAGLVKSPSSNVRPSSPEPDISGNRSYGCILTALKSVVNYLRKNR